GAGGNDIFLGLRDNDLLIGDNEALDPRARTIGGGSDFLRGGPATDRFRAGLGDDHCQGGTGDDDDLSRPPCEKRGSIP
ncbi:MAG TPA: hypothetical protein VE997_08565, partial [Candidatus Limnocylindria bacterium]|nr:hypothetical protein [Candidatus Limnocylindria bacterium]